MTARPSFIGADRPWPPRRASAPLRAIGLLMIDGWLLKPAELRLTPGGARGFLTFEVETGMGFPFAVWQAVSEGPDALQAATVLQHKLTRGATVRVKARGCSPRTDHGRAVLQLIDVLDVAITPEE